MPGSMTDPLPTRAPKRADSTRKNREKGPVAPLLGFDRSNLTLGRDRESVHGFGNFESERVAIARQAATIWSIKRRVDDG